MSYLLLHRQLLCQNPLPLQMTRYPEPIQLADEVSGSLDLIYDISPVSSVESFGEIDCSRSTHITHRNRKCDCSLANDRCSLLAAGWSKNGVITYLSRGQSKQGVWPS